MKKNGFASIIILVLAVLVLVGGAYYFGTIKNKTTLAPIASVQPSSSPVVISTPDPATANWKTYSNTKYGFSIKYPNTWVDMAAPGQSDETTLGFEVRFSKTNDYLNDFVAIRIRDGGNDMNIFQKVADLQNGQELKMPGENITKKGETKVGGSLAVQYSLELLPVGENPEIFFQTPIAAQFEKNNRVYDISLAALASEKTVNPETLKIFDQILSTFHFTN